MKVNINQIGVYGDDKYFRVFIKRGSHILHSEKLSKENASNLLFDLEDEIEPWPITLNVNVIIV